MTSILVVDDDSQIRRALRINLEARDYEVSEADTGPGAIRMAADRNPDLVLLDLGLPQRDGIEVITAIRGWSLVPIIVITARHDEQTKIVALDSGADDYLTKPFSINELLARIRASLRRAVAPALPSSAVVATDDFSIDLAAHRTTLADGTAVKLTPTEFAIISQLVTHPGLLVTHRMLIESVWGPTAQPEASLLRVHMNHIRAKLEPRPDQPRYFLTEPHIGFRFTPGGMS